MDNGHELQDFTFSAEYLPVEVSFLHIKIFKMTYAVKQRHACNQSLASGGLPDP